MSGQDRVLQLLGLCRKAGKIQTGEFSVVESIRAHSAKLVVVSRDASENSKHLYADKARFYRVPCYLTSYSKEELGRSVGQAARVALAVTDRGLADLVCKALPQEMRIGQDPAGPADNDNSNVHSKENSEEVKD